MPTITDEDVERIAKKHKIEDKDGLRAAIEYTARRYEYHHSSQKKRISKEHKEALRKFEKAANKLHSTWKEMPEQCRKMFYITANVTESMFQAPEAKAPDSSGRRVNLATSGKLISQAIVELIRLAADNPINFLVQPGPPQNASLSSMIDNLRQYWVSTLSRKATFTHDGSPFENFIRDVTDRIDREQMDNIHGVLRELLYSR